MAKIHLQSENKNLTVCGGRATGFATSSKKLFDATDFENFPIYTHRCLKCQAVYDDMIKKIIKK